MENTILNVNMNLSFSANFFEKRGALPFASVDGEILYISGINPQEFAHKHTQEIVKPQTIIFKRDVLSHEATHADMNIESMTMLHFKTKGDGVKALASYEANSLFKKRIKDEILTFNTEIVEKFLNFNTRVESLRNFSEFIRVANRDLFMNEATLIDIPHQYSIIENQNIMFHEHKEEQVIIPHNNLESQTTIQNNAYTNRQTTSQHSTYSESEVIFQNNEPSYKQTLVYPIKHFNNQTTLHHSEYFDGQTIFHNSELLDKQTFLMHRNNIFDKQTTIQRNNQLAMLYHGDRDRSDKQLIMQRNEYFDKQIMIQRNDRFDRQTIIERKNRSEYLDKQILIQSGEYYSDKQTLINHNEYSNEQIIMQRSERLDKNFLTQHSDILNRQALILNRVAKNLIQTFNIQTHKAFHNLESILNIDQRHLETATLRHFLSESLHVSTQQEHSIEDSVIDMKLPSKLNVLDAEYKFLTNTSNIVLPSQKALISHVDLFSTTNLNRSTVFSSRTINPLSVAVLDKTRLPSIQATKEDELFLQSWVQIYLHHLLHKEGYDYPTLFTGIQASAEKIAEEIRLQSTSTWSKIFSASYSDLHDINMYLITKNQANLNSIKFNSSSVQFATPTIYQMNMDHKYNRYDVQHINQTTRINEEYAILRAKTKFIQTDKREDSDNIIEIANVKQIILNTANDIITQVNMEKIVKENISQSTLILSKTLPSPLSLIDQDVQKFLNNESTVAPSSIRIASSDSQPAISYMNMAHKHDLHINQTINTSEYYIKSKSELRTSQTSKNENQIDLTTIETVNQPILNVADGVIQANVEKISKEITVQATPIWSKNIYESVTNENQAILNAMKINSFNVQPIMPVKPHIEMTYRYDTNIDQPTIDNDYVMPKLEANIAQISRNTNKSTLPTMETASKATLNFDENTSEIASRSKNIEAQLSSKILQVTPSASQTIMSQASYIHMMHGHIMRTQHLRTNASVLKPSAEFSSSLQPKADIQGITNRDNNDKIHMSGKERLINTFTDRFRDRVDLQVLEHIRQNQQIQQVLQIQQDSQTLEHIRHTSDIRTVTTHEEPTIIYSDIPGAAIVHVNKKAIPATSQSQPSSSFNTDIEFIKTTAKEYSKKEKVPNIAINTPISKTKAMSDSIHNMDQQVNVIADKVYNIIERRLRSERMRKGWM
ncbi:MAG: hypothetical protein FWC91_09120 [Defluviitaleaceae bacterium]|nr:hypothetical protein [Defluviitaleaceae bacterium]